jgi:allene oxide cyclase
MDLSRLLLFAISAAPLPALAGCANEPAEPEPITLVLVEHADTDVVEDLGMMGDSAGDLLTFANPLFDEANKKQVGTNQGYCVRIQPGVSWECFWTAILAEGQITVEGPFFDAKDSVLAVTGGTGEYSGVSGQMTLHARNAKGTEFDFTYELE